MRLRGLDKAERSPAMKRCIKFSLLLLLFILSACNSSKYRQIREISLLKAYQEQVSTYAENLQHLETLLWEKAFTAHSESFEWQSDSLLHWHPDSGLYLQPAVLRVKGRQSQHLAQASTSRQTASESKVLSNETRQIGQEQSEQTTRDVQRFKRAGYRWWFILVPGVLLLIWLIRRLRVF